MATIRFESVTITAKAIEVSGIEEPQLFLEGLGLKDSAVIESAKPARQVDTPSIEEPARQVDTPKQDPKALISILELEPEEFKGVRRLRDVVQIFVDAGVTDTDQIVEQCVRIQNDVPLLKKVVDVGKRMPIAVQKWREAQA